MNPYLADSLLRTVMGATADPDFPHQLGILRSLANYKYDDYEQYAPGREFIESLALWLSQFEVNERRHALEFVQQRLIYLSELEMRHLVALMARDRVPLMLQDSIAKQLAIPPYRVVELRNHQSFHRARRASLFLGMSDGARIDQFRRNSETLSNEQFAINYELSEQRTKKMLDSLRSDLADQEAGFDYVFLVDDFAGSGRTILRTADTGGFEGRLVRFVEDTLPKLGDRKCPKVYITLYLTTEQAVHHLQDLLPSYPSPPWPENELPVVLSAMTLYDQARLSCDTQHSQVDQQFAELLEKYYTPAIEDEHKGTVKYGFADCALPLILSHNTPNNSVYLLWEKNYRKPLFPRFERHESHQREN